MFTESEIAEKMSVAKAQGRSARSLSKLASKLRNPERVAAEKRRWYAKNRERLLARNHANHPLVREPYCVRTRTSRRYKNEMRLVSTYGMEKSAFNDLRIKQHNCCAICREVFMKTPNVDHDHVSGAVRGLLCSQCNVGLGCLKDSVEKVRYALNYLESFVGVVP